MLHDSKGKIRVPCTTGILLKTRGHPKEADMHASLGSFGCSLVLRRQHA